MRTYFVGMGAESTMSFGILRQVLRGTPLLDLRGVFGLKVFLYLNFRIPHMTGPKRKGCVVECFVEAFREMRKHNFTEITGPISL